MDCIILAAGYATRLYPLTKNTPKPLLEVGGKPILSRLMDQIQKVTEVERIHVVTNAKFAEAFRQWANTNHFSKPVEILDDGTTSNENRLGAIGDLNFAVKQQQIAADLLVLAGDNLFEFDLTDFVSFFLKKQTDVITCHQLDELSRLQGSGIVELDQAQKVLGFQEKPKQPKTKWAVPPFYIYQRSTVPLIEEYLTTGNNPDAPGHFIPWLIKHKPVHAFIFQGERYDIGTIRDFYKAQEIFAD